MDYQPMNKAGVPEPTESKNGLMIALVALIIIAIAAWYFWPTISSSPSSYGPAGSVEEAAGSLSSGDTTSDIAKDIDNAPGSAGLNSDLNSLDSSLNSF